MKKIISFAMAGIMSVCMLTGCGPKYEKFSDMLLTQQYFNTVITIISYQPSQEDFDEMVDYLEGEMDRLNKLYDIYHTYPGINNIKTINDNAGVAPVQVDQDIIDLLLFSKEWHAKSGGRLNIAMGSVLKVWHDKREEYDFYGGDVQLPELSLLQEKAQHIDINCVEIDDENNTVFITDPLLRLDVGAVAKGFATEMICDKLAEKYDNFCISAGGNVKCHGQPKDDRVRWGIGIENPMVDENWKMIGGNADMAYFNTDMSLVCSGGYQRFMIIDGQRYHHLVDPTTLFPEEKWAGVAILCEDSGMADALSTTLFLMTPDEAMDFMFMSDDSTAGDYNSDLQERIQSYKNIQENAAEILTKASSEGININVVSSWDIQLIPIGDNSASDEELFGISAQSDGLIDTYYSSFGCWTIPLNDVGAAAQNKDQRNTEGECENHNHLNSVYDTLDPEHSLGAMCHYLDASTCALPDNTWFIRNMKHGTFDTASNSMDFLEYLMTADKTLTVYSANGVYRQFMSYNRYVKPGYIDVFDNVVVDPYLLGDADCDGDIDASDARLALRISAKLEKYPAVDTAYFKNADINGDGEITAADARIILRCSAGLANPKDYQNTVDRTEK